MACFIVGLVAGKEDSMGNLPPAFSPDHHVGLPFLALPSPKIVLEIF
jgi:hypothetical protein